MRPGHPRFGDLYEGFLGRYSLLEIGVESDEFKDLRARDEGRRVDL